jgi:hypothetical protein|tara:strand:- start:778 stop:1209 length:432 start_codon:yes stop_codon:yes gene_type:complete
MFDYKTLDLIADLYTPLLLLTLIILMARSIIATDWQRSRIEFFLLFYGFIIVYGLMLADQLFSIWSSVGLDYSTHTAAALIIVTLLGFFQPSVRKISWCSLLVYVALMRYKNYHTVSDMVTTAIIVGAIFIPVVQCFSRFYKK